jgi:hypothetical protein
VDEYPTLLTGRRRPASLKLERPCADLSRVDREQQLLAIVQAQTEIVAARPEPDAVAQIVAVLALEVIGAQAAVVELAVGDEIVRDHVLGTVTPHRLAAPLVHDRKPVGTLSVYADHSEAFTGADSETLTLRGQMIGSLVQGLGGAVLEHLQYDAAGQFLTGSLADYLLPTVVHCTSPDAAIAGKEYMFPFVTVVECPEARMLDAIGPTLVCSAITCNPAFRRRLLDAVHIDRLNLGPVPTTQLNWLQPHEGNLIEFLFRERAFQTADL